ncbi:MAG: poly-gamma-glutamate synthase PgsB [Candidatus Aminicenantes bacterium RBG_16_63_16]|nr:MAG: poly-gamma-glutamate synthase PgsB [Candidatus Aminicenantes bacterium RBG_16_63_16]
MVVYFFLEKLAVARAAGRIPLRIAVTGTRGKSTVTRLIAAALRADGRSVLAKTTGSKAMIILPDGTEEEIVRRGLPTILEQKGILSRAASLDAGVFVSELMSVRPDILAVESRRLIRPQILVITNARVDHREEMGTTRAEIAGGLAAAIPSGATVFILEEENRPEFERAAREAGSRLITVKSGRPPEADSEPLPALGQGFEGDLALALAVSDRLGVPRGPALRGIAGARPDFGSLRAWDAVLGDPPAPWTLVSAFAANDPESSRRALELLAERPLEMRRELVGVLNLRADRGDRTLQWIEALDKGFFRGFAALYVVGAHTRAGRWRRPSQAAPSVRPLRGSSVEPLMEAIVQAHGGGAVLVGLGNMGGLGRTLVERWEKIGRAHAL